MTRTNGLDAGFNIRMKLRENGHRVAQFIIGMSMRQAYLGCRLIPRLDIHLGSHHRHLLTTAAVAPRNSPQRRGRPIRNEMVTDMAPSLTGPAPTMVAARKGKNMLIRGHGMSGESFQELIGNRIADIR